MSCEDLGVLKAQHEGLSDRVDRMEHVINGRLKKIDEKLDIFISRPSWWTVTIITFLSSGFFTMLAMLIRRGP